MGSIALVRCVLVLRRGLAGVVWYPDAGWSSAFKQKLECIIAAFEEMGGGKYEVISEYVATFPVETRLAKLRDLIIRWSRD